MGFYPSKIYDRWYFILEKILKKITFGAPLYLFKNSHHCNPWKHLFKNLRPFNPWKIYPFNPLFKYYINIIILFKYSPSFNT